MRCKQLDGLGDRALEGLGSTGCLAAVLGRGRFYPTEGNQQDHLGDYSNNPVRDFGGLGQGDCIAGSAVGTDYMLDIF